MRVATLQFAPVMGEVEANIAWADALIARAGLEDGEGKVDLLVLPELAFCGYNFPSLPAIRPYLELTAAGPTARWAFATARRLGCVVSVGYPERATRWGDGLLRGLMARKTDGSPLASSSVLSGQAVANGGPGLVNGGVEGDERDGEDGEEGVRGGDDDKYETGFYNYNSTLTVGPAGQILAHYRKTHLYYTDETWALPSPSGWLSVGLPLPLPSPSFAADTATASTSTSSPTSTATTKHLTSTNPSPSTNGIHASPIPSNLFPPCPTNPTMPLTKTTFGICMDLNPHLFLAPREKYELATHALTSHAELVVCSMAWLTWLSASKIGLASPNDDGEGADNSNTANGENGSSAFVKGKGEAEGQRDGDGDEDEDEDEDRGNGENVRAAVRAKPDLDTLAYWLDRLSPLISAPRFTTVVIANRCGIEPGDWRDPKHPVPTQTTQVERPAFEKCARVKPPIGDGVGGSGEGGAGSGDGGSVGGGNDGGEGTDGANAPGKTEEARYAGTSCVLRLGGGQVEVLGVMGRAEEGVCVVETADFP